jgi:hypothetical protein
LLASAVLAGIAASGASPAYAQAADAETLRQMRQELESLKAAEAEAKAAERARAQRIDALAQQLARASGEPVVQTPAPSEVAQVPVRQVREGGPTFEVYGFAQVDYIQDFNRVDPAWEAAFRPSKIPTTDGQFGEDGQSIFSVRQSRLGAQARQQIGGQDLFVKFEIDMYGTGDDAGQTTIRLRHAYGSWGPILAGQTNTLFMDGDTFPNTIDYWGPVGMVFVRTPQIRYTHVTGPHKFSVALEKPSNDIDAGAIRQIDPNLGSSIHGNEKYPDLTAAYRYDGDWGHVQLAGILRDVAYETSGTPDSKPRGSETGWGLNLSSNIKTFDKDVLHLSVVYSEGIASYMNDGGTDLGPQLRNTAPVVAPPIAGVPAPSFLEPKAVPTFGAMIYYDHYWNDEWASSFGWSMHKQDVLTFQQANAYQNGQYVSGNILYTPDKRILVGGELLWGQREDKNGATGEDTRIQFTFKYSFSSNDMLQ